MVITPTYYSKINRVRLPTNPASFAVHYNDDCHDNIIRGGVEQKSQEKQFWGHQSVVFFIGGISGRWDVDRARQFFLYII